MTVTTEATAEPRRDPTVEPRRAPAVETGPRWLSHDEQQAWIAVSSMITRLPAILDNQLQRDAGLTLFEYFVLSRLSMAEGRVLRMSELAQVANGSLSRLSNVVKRLEQRGWVVRSPDPQDGRITIAALTESGWERVVTAAPGHVTAVRSYFMDGLTDDQLLVLADIGQHVVDRIRAGGCAPAD